MKVLYLPSDPKYRAFVERALEFVEQVYKDELLADLEIVAFSPTDPDDFVEVVLVRELAEYINSYYDRELRRAIVAICDGACHAIDAFDELVEEVTHHVLYDVRFKETVMRALVKDVPRLNEVATRRLRKADRHNLNMFFNELDTGYIVKNYFLELKVRPELMPWLPEVLGTTIGYYNMVATTLVEGALADATRIMYEEVVGKRNPLPNFREATHAIFTKAIKRFPAEVYKSNPSKYKIMYTDKHIRELPL
jgi:hypothetical protein